MGVLHLRVAGVMGHAPGVPRNLFADYSRLRHGHLAREVLEPQAGSPCGSWLCAHCIFVGGLEPIEIRHSDAHRGVSYDQSCGSAIDVRGAVLELPIAKKLSHTVVDADWWDIVGDHFARRRDDQWSRAVAGIAGVKIINPTRSLFL